MKKYGLVACARYTILPMHTNLGICASVVVGVHSLLVSVAALSSTWLQKKGLSRKIDPTII